jgi:hypothetical protein
LPGGIKNVDWSGRFASATPGLTVAWQWSAANYSDFTADYNSIAPKPTDDNHVSIYQNSDHAGTPEGTDSISGRLWKSFVVGGATGGGGANYTGSGSSTIQFPPCDCPLASLLKVEALRLNGPFSQQLRKNSQGLLYWQP